MAEEAAPQGAPAEKKRNPMVMAAGVGVVMLLLGLGGGYLLNTFLADPPPAAEGADGVAAAPAGEGGATAPATAGAPAAAKSEIADLEAFTINLRDSAGGRKLAMKLSLEGPPNLKTVVNERNAQVRDAIITLASDYSYIELDGMDGRLRLRDEIQRNLNSVLEPHGVQVQRVYYTAFVVE
jgi:flagellar basal body-associated protein FliL